jgi:hypothetical protein
MKPTFGFAVAVVVGMGSACEAPDASPTARADPGSPGAGDSGATCSRRTLLTSDASYFGRFLLRTLLTSDASYFGRFLLRTLLTDAQSSVRDGSGFFRGGPRWLRHH